LCRKKAVGLVFCKLTLLGELTSAVAIAARSIASSGENANGPTWKIGDQCNAWKDPRRAHRDVRDIKVIFVDEPDEIINPLGINGVGEIGIVAVAAAIANAVYHATGKRVRELPITLDKLDGRAA